MANGFVNWDTDWSNCAVVKPKKSRMRWCNTCMEYHDLGCFFKFKGRWLKCCLNMANRSWCIGKIKGGAGAKGAK